jgi:ribonuclease-3
MNNEPMNNEPMNDESVWQQRAPAPDLEPLQHTLGYRFRDPNLLLLALTHPSYVNEHPEDATGDNQRLEFLGDAVIDFIAGAWVYRPPRIPGRRGD